MTTLQDFRAFLQHKSCRWHNRPVSLAHGKIKYYVHEGGIDLDGVGKVWLYVECPKCDYQWSFAKLGFI